jgi:hypothetical protein
VAESTPYMPEVCGKRDCGMAQEESRQVARDSASVQKEGAIKALAVGFARLHAVEAMGSEKPTATQRYCEKVVS